MDLTQHMFDDLVVFIYNGILSKKLKYNKREDYLL